MSVQGEGDDAEALVAEALVEVRGAGGGAVMGRLDAAHLADHPSAVSALRASVAVRAFLALVSPDVGRFGRQCWGFALS